MKFLSNFLLVKIITSFLVLAVLNSVYIFKKYLSKNIPNQIIQFKKLEKIESRNKQK